MAYQYLNFSVWLKDIPDKKISMLGFCKRGVILKARRILASMGICSFSEEIKKFEAQEITE